MRSLEICTRYLKIIIISFLLTGVLAACSDDDKYMNPASPDFTPEDVITQAFENNSYHKITGLNTNLYYRKG